MEMKRRGEKETRGNGEMKIKENKGQSEINIFLIKIKISV